MRKILAYCLIYFLIIPLIGSFIADNALAVSDPRSLPNNKFGIGILSPESDTEAAASLVNSNGGDWGYVSLVIRKDERQALRWQGVFNNLNKKHLIPVVRIATAFNKQGVWEAPGEKDAAEWASFLDELSWPVKNRYIQVYNEVNRASEWGSEVDPSGYAKELKKTIDALKSKSDNFFILNAPLDLALDNSADSLDAELFLLQMEAAVPGIFLKIDGLASHSYPNPGFVANPGQEGRLGIRGYKWETGLLSSLIPDKTLPVFITETGWVRKSDGKYGLSETTISGFYEDAFSGVWNDPNIVCVTPFILSFPEPNFYPFSFKKNGDGEVFFDYYYKVQSLAKVKGNPERQNRLSDFVVAIQDKVIKNSPREITIIFKNDGNFMWDTENNIKIEVNSSAVKVEKVKWNNKDIYPGQEAVAKLQFRASEEGKFPILFKVNHLEENLGSQLSYVEAVTYFTFIVDRIKNLI